MFYQKLRELRISKGINQTEFGKVIGVAQQTIGSWETGRTEPNLKQLCKIAGYFEVTTDELLCRNSSRNDIL